MGVDLALRKLDKLVEKPDGRPIYTLGPIIHNPQVLEEYEALGVHRVAAPEEIPPGSHAVIRAHGVPRFVEESLKTRGVCIEDATCPRVKKAQVLISTQAARGGTLLLYGEADHPEVRGLVSYADGDTVLFDSLPALLEHTLDAGKHYFLAAQTTQDRAQFERIREHLRQTLGPETPVLETICDATMERQREAVALAGEVDAMVVAGGYTSGNTRRLADVARAKGVPCVHVETPDELPMDRLRGFSIIGLTAGASTPQKIIDAIESMLREL
jgi:4-hydroxy-3-methylbut-2-enyl diphosphate reductase